MSKMDIERGDTEPSWGGRLRDFSQDTTFHGVRYLGAHTRLLRKLIWCLAIMGSTSLFLYITIENIKKIYTYPKTVNVDVTYKDKLPFPAVTICNNNPLRITEAFHKGLYDDLLEHYQPDAVTQGLGGDEYTYVPVCMADYRDLVNQSEWTYAYSGVTAIGCQHLCTRLHPNHCTSLAYDRSGMSCVLTSNSLEDAVGNGTQEGTPGCASGPTYVDWYRRIRALQVNFEITCDFEESECPLTNIESADEKVETWNEVMVAGHKPSKDHTTGSAFGSFTQMGITSNRQGYVSAMRSAFYQFDDMCLELFYAQTGELAVGFSVKTISEDLRVDALFGVQAGEYESIDLTEALTDSDDSSSSSSDSYTGSSTGAGSSSGTDSYSGSGTNSYSSSSTGSGTNSYSGSYSGGVTRRRRKKRQTSGSGSYSDTSGTSGSYGGTSGSTGGTSGSYSGASGSTSGTSGSTGGTSGSTGGSSSSYYTPSSSSNGGTSSITFTQIDQNDDSNEPVVQPEPSIEWKRVYNQLPRGVYQLEIEAIRPNGSEKTSGIVVDDISIWPCAKFRRNCKRFSDGSDFRGSTSVTTSGETCAPWNDVISDQLEQWATFKPSDSSNHCRNLASDAKGPGCYVLHPTGYYTYEHCTIPYCGCGPRSFTCDDGQCILKSLTCNGAFDCIDGSDELTACTSKRQVTCDFESDFICGYQVSTWSSTRWRATKIIQLGQSTDATEDYYGSDQGTILDLDVKSPLEGDTVTVTTPVHNSTEDLCLTFQFYKYRHIMDTIAQLRVYRDQTLLWSDGAHRCPQGSYVCSGWSEAELLLPRGRYNVVFEATLGLGESTDYAIDNVKVMDIVDCPTVAQTLQMNDTSDAGNTTLTNGTESGNETETNETDTTVAPNTRVGPGGAGGGAAGSAGGGGDPRGAAPYTGTCNFRSGDLCGYTVHSSNQRFSWDLIADEFIHTYLQSLQDNPNTGCHTEYWTKTGQFETVNFPNRYTTANCRYRIKSVAGSTIYINFLHFHLENAYSGQCKYDSVNFYELDTQNPLSPTVCGLQKPFSLTFTNVSGVDVVFKADYYDSFSGFTAQYTIMEVPGERYKMVVKSAVTASKEHVTTSLISPMLNHDSGEHCLGFTVLIKAAFEVNLRYEDGTLEELWRVRDGVYSQFTVFRLFIVPLPLGKYQIEFRTDFLPKGMPASLSDIEVLPFNCLQPDAGLVKPEALSCNFKTVTICGYIDVSRNPERWIQNFYYENLVNDTKLREDYDAGRLTFLTQPMNDTSENATYINDTSTLRELFIQTYFNGTLDNVDYSFISGSSLPVYRTIVGGMSCDEDSKNIICLLVSRPVNATEPHCMQFRYYFAYITTQLGFFIINEVNGANQTNQTETYVALGSIQSDTTSRGPADFVKVKEWQRGQVELPEGVYRVMITASDVVGFGATRLGDISVTNGSCGYIEDVRNVTVLSSDDGWMTLNDTTSSQGGGRDGFKNSSGWDPWPNNNTTPTTPTRQVRPRKSVAGDMDMSTFFIAASHSLEDMLISCYWDGVNCSIDNFVREYTGLGVCYTFNQDKNKILESTRTGAQFGLSLVLNTEQYEQAPSETTDAGIKVHLHSQEDVPTITDTGTAIPLSMHSFISVTYAKTETLPDPYSNCTEAKHTVEFYENDPYTVARCRRHCDAERVTGFCNCKMLHLPGPTRFCTMQEYFTCLRHVQQNSTNSCPMCTDACSIKAYSTDTSYATLSSNSIEQLLKQNTDLLEASYHKALDVRSRADPTILVDQIQRVKEIIDQLRRVLKLTDQHASQGQLSAFTFGKQALTHFVNMVVRDIQSGFDNIDTFKLDYMLGYGQRRVNLVQGLDGIRANLTSVLDLKQHVNSSPRLTARVNGLTQACSDVADLVDIILNEDEVNDHHQHLNYLPAKVYLTKESKAECTKTITGVKANVGILKTNLLNGNQILDPFNFAIAGYLANASKEIHNCVNEFGEILSSAKSWYDENDFALNDTADILDYNIYFDYNSTTVDLIATLEKYEAMLLQLTEHNLTKLELAQFINAAEINQIEGYLKSTYDTIKKDVYMILENAISKVEKESITAYQRTLGHLSNIQQFYISDKTKTVFSDQARAMHIFYRPYIFSDSFGSIGFQFKTVPETYVIWPANKDFKEFADHHAQQHLVSLVKGFFGPVKDAMSTAMESILTSSNDVSESMKTFGDSLAVYVKSSNLDIQFIQDSFLKLDIYYGELKYEAIQQQEAYGVVAFFTEMGGTMGLLIGASVLTICEIIDFLLFTAFQMITARKVRPKSHRINVSPPPPYKESL